MNLTDLTLYPTNEEEAKEYLWEQGILKNAQSVLPANQEAQFISVISSVLNSCCKEDVL